MALVAEVEECLEAAQRIVAFARNSPARAKSPPTSETNSPFTQPFIEPT
jgi:hypothetical protein